MNINEYNTLYPNERVWRARLTKADGTSAVLCDGMLQFDEDSACNLAGPFEGNYAYFAIQDRRNVAGWTLLTEAQERQRIRFARWMLPFGKYGDDAQSEEHLQRRLEALSERERKEWQRKQTEYTLDVATVEKPFALFIAGNDDSTWTKFFLTEQAAREELALLEAVQPLSWHEAIYNNGFVFTN